MKPLSKVRSAARRTAAKLGDGRRALGGGFRRAATRARDRVRDASSRVWRWTGVPRLIAAARSNPRVAIAWAAGGLVLCAWIAWAVYTTAEHGASAGLGVLISWPLAAGALAIVAAPFVAAAMLIRRRRGGPPRIAGGAEIPADSSEGEAMTGGTYPG